MWPAYTLIFDDVTTLSVQKAPTSQPAAPAVSPDEPSKDNLGFIHAFVAAISVIIVSELGDKTFFIAAIMAMRYNRLTVLAGAMLALGLMTCLSGIITSSISSFSCDFEFEQKDCGVSTALVSVSFYRNIYSSYGTDIPDL